MIAIRITTFIRPKGGYLMKRALIGGIGVVALLAGVQDVYAQARPAAPNPRWGWYASVRPIPPRNPMGPEVRNNRGHGCLKACPARQAPAGQARVARWPRSGSLPPLLPRPVRGEEFLAAGKAVGLEEEAENDGAVGRHRLVPVAGRPPDELAGSAHALGILGRALENERLLEGVVRVQRH